MNDNGGPKPEGVSCRSYPALYVGRGTGKWTLLGKESGSKVIIEGSIQCATSEASVT